ncbi:hypothetical protein, partial [Streptomyces sp. URMC 129]|uniref:hypothetical protein n=1 Tax=Streptomyces sp. URMC 129 TaxID=3423407 RepID=UPI003F53BDB0
MDPWLAEDPGFPTLWSRLTARWASAVTAVVVVLSRTDEETGANAARLRSALALSAAGALRAPFHEVESASALARTTVWLAAPPT